MTILVERIIVAFNVKLFEVIGYCNGKRVLGVIVNVTVNCGLFMDLGVCARVSVAERY